MVDPNKLAAFANQPPGGGKKGKPAPGQPPKGGDKGGQPPKGAKGDQKPKDEGYEEGGSGEFGALFPLLEASKDDLEANCDELDHDMLTDQNAELADEDKQILVESFEMLPQELKAEMIKSLDGIEMDAAHKIADHLAEEDMISDADRTAGYLFRVGALVASGDLKAEGGKDDDSGEHETPEDEDEEDEDEEEPEEGED